MIVGAGGTCRACVYALHKNLGMEPIYLLNRDESEVQDVLKQFPNYPIRIIDPHSKSPEDLPQSIQVVVNAVPDIAPATSEEKDVRRILTSIITMQSTHPVAGQILLDMCYKPRWTSVLDLANKNKWTTVSGIEAMIRQALEQVVLWTGIPKTRSTRKASYDRKLGSFRKTSYPKILLFLVLVMLINYLLNS